MAVYNFKEIESKWQKRWYENKTFKAIDFHPTKPKYYVLYEFFNISGNLHMGHLKGTVPADALARYKRLQGYNVLFPIGGDAFGLPAENAAIKKGTNPKEFVKVNSENAYAQARMLGLSFDWDRTFCTSDPEYYKWTQWIFMQLLKNGKAYRENTFVNFCPKCKTSLSNEDSQGGVCDRCGSQVYQSKRNVWFLKMKEYSDKLLDNVDHITMQEHLKEAQRNWIGKSEGVQLKFDVVNEKKEKINNLEIFTTCIETVYGVTFVAIAPEAKIVESLKPYISNLNDVENYIKQTSLRTEFERMSDNKEKTGCKLQGIFAINPVNGNKVELYLADFVLANYATGAVMAVPAHDQRDYEFAQKFNIPCIQVITGDVSCHALEKQTYLNSADSVMINSGEFNGLKVKDAKEKIKQMVIDKGFGTIIINYKMQDWSFNRQRFWGEPFPVVYCDKCGIVSLEEKDLPLLLPETNDYLPNDNGDSPLSKVQSFVNCKCPKCGGGAKRETDTMPNWAGSSWYWLRFCDPHNNEKLADMEKLKYWGQVDAYIGGTEHITRHVLYAFFWQNFLYEIGVVPTRDPFVKKLGSGLILDSEGKKMSKSSANGVIPTEIVEKYGSDVARLHTTFLAAYEDNVMWTFKGIEGITNFLDKVWKLQDIIKGENVSKEHEVDLNVLIKKAMNDYENLKMNTCIAACMSFIKKIKDDGFITREEFRQFLIVLNPIAPHITSELYELNFGKDIAFESFPTFDENKLELDVIKLPVQVNGKLKGLVEISRDSSEDDVINECKQKLPQLNELNVVKTIYVKNKILNLIVKD